MTEEIKSVLKNDGVIVIGLRSKESAMKLEFMRYDFQMYSVAEAALLLEENALQVINTLVMEHNGYDAVCITAGKRSDT